MCMTFIVHPDNPYASQSNERTDGLIELLLDLETIMNILDYFMLRPLYHYF